MFKLDGTWLIHVLLLGLIYIQYASSQLANYTLPFAGNVCYGQTMYNLCPPEYAINVTKAVFGRELGADICISNGMATDSSCLDDNIIHYIKGLCDGNNRCSIDLNETYFDTSCPGINGYLSVQFNCQPQVLSMTACEESNATMECPSGVMSIVEAKYSVTEPGICGNTEQLENCTATDAFDLVTAFCNGKEKCTINVGDNFFKDQCLNARKYLQVDYICTSCRNAEGAGNSCDNWQSIGECLPGANFAWMMAWCYQSCSECDVAAACENLGNDDDCEYLASRGECSAGLDYMYKNCQRSCNLCDYVPPTTTPAPTTWVPATLPDNVQTLDSCEGRSAYLSCSNGTSIRIISAFFGRKDNTTCFSPDIQSVESLNLECESYYEPFMTARKLCDGRKDCYMTAHILAHGDPCPGYSKYLTIDWVCQECEDKYISDNETCSSMARDDQACDSNRYWMTDNCFQTCSDCQYAETCENEYGDDDWCDYWSAVGECDWVMSVCKKSCHACKPEQTTTTTTTTSTTTMPSPTIDVATLPTHYEYPSIFYHGVLCTGASLQMNCPDEYVIKMQNIVANQGAAGDICTSSASAVTASNTPCENDDASSVVNALCKDKQECSVNSNDLFKEACLGYLNISFICEPVTYTQRSCEGDLMTIECPYGVMTLTSVVYGRTDENACADGSAINEVNCTAQDGYDLASTMCNAKAKCQILPGDSYFGDPCPDVSKYLDVSYMCRSCSNKFGDDDKCDQWAQNGECTYNTGWMFAWCYKSCTSCAAEDACRNAYSSDELCESWASKGECISASGYMSVWCRHACNLCLYDPPTVAPPTSTSVPPTTPSSLLTLESCEGGLVHLTCDPGNRIKIFNAFFGRKDNTTCVDENTDPANLQMCDTDAESLLRTTRVCDGREDCHITVTFEVLGDPCPGVSKHFVVDYTCQPCENAIESSEGMANCTSSSESGECETNRFWMIENCYKSCSACQIAELCNNNYGNDDLCDYWSFIGECGRNPIWMSENCAKSCRLCNETTSTTSTTTMSTTDSSLVTTTTTSNAPSSTTTTVASTTTSSTTTTMTVPTIPIDVDNQYIEVCEGFAMQMSCPAGTHLEILDAFYGRNDTVTCPHQNDIATTNVECSMADVLSFTRSQCSNKESCQFYIHPSILEDICTTTYKFFKAVYVCIPNYISCEALCVNGVCLPDGCQCDSGFQGQDCSQFGCDDQCNHHGTCIASNTCDCDEGWSGQSCDVPDCSAVNNCNGNGICVDLNRCWCYPNFEGNDCSTCSVTPAVGDMCAECAPCQRGSCIPDAESLSLTHSYLGCYGDQDDDLDLSWLVWDTEQFSSVMSCMGACLLSSFKYAGIKDGRKCYCGDSYGKHGTSNTCSSTCQGYEPCGGVSSLSIYRTFAGTCECDSAQFAGALCNRCIEGFSGEDCTIPVQTGATGTSSTTSSSSSSSTTVSTSTAPSTSASSTTSPASSSPSSSTSTTTLPPSLSGNVGYVSETYFRVKLSVPWDPVYSDVNNPKTQQLQQAVTQTLHEFYSGIFSDFKYVIVQKLSEGSTIATCFIEFVRPISELEAVDIECTIANQEPTFNIYSVIFATSDSAEICRNRDSYCENEGVLLRKENGEFDCLCTEGHQGHRCNQNSRTQTIAIAVLVVVVVVTLSIVIVVCYCITNRSEKMPEHYGMVDSQLEHPPNYSAQYDAIENHGFIDFNKSAI